MKTINFSPSGFKRKGGVLLAVALSSLMFTEIAQANTSAGTVLRNTVSVAYDDTGGAPQTAVTATVDVTVDLVPAVTWGTAPSDQTIGSNSALPSGYTLTLTNSGNGSDTYTLTDNTVVSCVGGTSALTAESFGLTPTPTTLGATVSSGTGVYAAGPNETTIPVSNLTPADFTAGNIVLIGATTYTVVSSAAGAGILPDSLVVTGDATGDVGAAGVQIGEQITVTYGGTGTSGTLSGSGGLCEHQHNLTATGSLATGGNTDVVQATGADYFTTLVRGVTLSVTKYVRNITTPGKNSGGGVAIYGATYYTAGVTGNPGETLEYLVVTTNSSSADADNVVFTDTMPTYTTYTASSLVVDANGDGTFDAPIAGDTESDAVAGGVIGVSGNTITVYAGVGGSEDGAGTGGTVQDVGEVGNDPSNQTAIRYRLTID